MTIPALPFDAVTITLNPAIDRTITISHFTPGAVNRVEAACDTAGGKGINVAAALADNGFRIAATGFLGRENAAMFEALFAEKGIADRFLRIEGETRVGLKISDPAAHETTDINFPGAAPEPQEIATLRREIEALDALWIVIGGSVPPGVDPGIYGELVATLKARGRKVVVDTSGEPLRRAIAAAPSMIKPNIHELEALLGETLRDEAAVIAAARSLVERGIELVAVSMGRDGACFVTAKDVVIARPPEIEVARTTVGAGDAMVAGIVAARIRGGTLEDCARTGTAFSVEALTRGGSGRAEPSAIAAAMNRVSLTRRT